jgi:hypothetical protein
MNREARIGLALVAALGAFVFFMLVVGSLGPVRPELEQLTVTEARSGPAPAGRYGHRELRIVGWYAELKGDCVEAHPQPAMTVPWLEASCPLRVLLPTRPAESVTQDEMTSAGLRLSAPTGRPFPPRAEPGGANLQIEQLVFVGHFDDPAAQQCAPALLEECRNTFVVSDYDGLVR